MKTLVYNNNLRTAVRFAAALSLAACGKTEPPSGPAAAPVAQVAFSDDAAGESIAAVVERRHFAIYNTSRLLFDDSAKVMNQPARAQEEGLQQALDQDIAACGIYAGPLTD